MFGLLDCNNFFASCERVFDPKLVGKAIVVLSNNDGCVVARSREAKQLGIPMGIPAFKIKELIDQEKVYAFSSNYLLYGDMSRRVMTLISEKVKDIEVYSIDESFMIMPMVDDIRQFGLDLIRHVSRGSGIPVSLGVAPTKTLAKVANHFAKKYNGYHGVCVIDTDEKRIKALQTLPVDEVWGIGRRLGRKLKAMGVYTAYDFSLMPRDRVRKMMTVTGEKMWCELNGQSCLDLEIDHVEKKQICTSRSFGSMISDLDGLAPAIATHAATCARKLRDQKSCALSLMPFIYTNRFRDDLPQCHRCIVVPLEYPTSDSRIIVSKAIEGLNKIYKPGYQYKKAGVIITEIVPEDKKPLDLFGQKDSDKSTDLMSAVDKINHDFGSHTVRFAIEKGDTKWLMHRKLLSRNYTTDTDDLIEINCHI